MNLPRRINSITFPEARSRLKVGKPLSFWRLYSSTEKTPLVRRHIVRDIASRPIAGANQSSNQPRHQPRDQFKINSEHPASAAQEPSAKSTKPTTKKRSAKSKKATAEKKSPNLPTEGRQFSLVCRDNDHLHFFPPLKKALRLDFDSLFEHGRSPAIVVLATPKQRHLLDPKSIFIKTLVRRTFSAAQRKGFDLQTLTVVTGLVDRIAMPDAYFLSPRGTSMETSESNRPMKSGQRELDVRPAFLGAEGVTVDIGITLSDPDDAVYTGQGSKHAPPRQRKPGHISLSFTQALPRHQISEKWGPLTRKTIDFSLAQTMMHTGSPFHLVTQEYVRDRNADTGAAFYKLLAETKRSHVDLEASVHELTALPPILRAPAMPSFHPLTQPQRIASSFGNVIQSFEEMDEHGHLGTKPASAELEDAIASGNVTRDRVGEHFPASFEVWAAVWPSSLRPILNWNSLNGQIETLFNSGASMYRAQGGGGGWEGRGGPITLEVDLSSEVTADDEAALVAYISGESSTVKPGNIVQFFAVAPVTLNGGWERRARASHIIGTLPPLAERAESQIGFVKFHSNTFSVLAERADVTVELCPAKPGYDHGAAHLGQIHSTRIPPLTSMWADVYPRRKDIVKPKSNSDAVPDSDSDDIPGPADDMGPELDSDVGPQLGSQVQSTEER